MAVLSRMPSCLPGADVSHPIRLPHILLEYVWHTETVAPGEPVKGNLIWANGDTTVRSGDVLQSNLTSRVSASMPILWVMTMHQTDMADQRLGHRDLAQGIERPRLCRHQPTNVSDPLKRA